MKKAFALSLIFVLLTAGLVQATQVKLINDPSVPGATGTVNVNKDRNGNYRVRVDVRHLAKPTELTPPRQVYLVWVQSGDNAPEVLGQLRVNENLQGSLEGTTPHDKFELFITAEDNPNTTSPSEPRLLRATVAP